MHLSQVLTATTPTATTTATPTAATTASTKAPTPATTPTTATTSTASTTSIAAPTTTPAATAITPATLALAAAALPTSGISSDILSTRDVSCSSRGVGGSKGGGGAPLKEGRAQSAMSSTYNDYTSLSYKEVLLEKVNSEAVVSSRAVEDGLEQQWQARSIGRQQRRTVPVLSYAVRSEGIRLTPGAGAKSGGAEPGGAEPGGVQPGGAESEGAGLRLLSLGVLLLLDVLRVLRHECLPGRSLSPRSSCASDLLSAPAFGVELPELETLPLETLKLEMLDLMLELVVPEVLLLLVLELLIPGVLELPGLVLETLRSLELLGLEELELLAMELETLELEELELEVLEALCGRDRTSFHYFSRFLVSPPTSLPPPLLCPLCDQSQPPFQPPSPLPAPSLYAEQTGGLTERRKPAYRPASPDHTGRRVPRPRPPPVFGTHAMALRPSSVPLRVPLPPPPESSLPAIPDPESDRARAASPSVSRLLATVVTDPSFDSTPASALVAELVDFAAACRLDFATALIAASESVCPPSVGGECALRTDVLEDRQEDFEFLEAAVPRFASMLLAHEGDPDALDIPTPRSYAEAITGPYSSQWQAPMDAEMASWKSTGTYVDKVPPSRANLVDGMWIFRGADYFQTFSPTPKMTTLRVLLHVTAQRDYEVHSLDFCTTFLQGSPHEEMWLRCPPGFTGTTLAALGFTPFTADPSLFLRTDTSQPPFYILVYVNDLVFATADTEALTLVNSEQQKRHTCTDLGELRSYLGLQITRDRARCTITLTQSHMVHQSVEPSGPYPELVGCLMYLMTCTRPDLAYPLSPLPRYVAPGRHRKVHWDAAKRVLPYLCSTSGMGLVLGGRGPVVLTGHADASWVDDSATQRPSQGYTFSLGSGSVSWLSTCSSLVLCSSCEAKIYAGAMAAQELRWLTYLVIDLGEQPRSPLVLKQKKIKKPARPAPQRAAAAHAATTALCPAEQRCPGRAAPPSPSRPPATTAAAAAVRATGAAGSAAGAGGAGGSTGSAGGAAGAGGGRAARGGQRQSLPLPDDPTPQQLRKWVLQQARPGGGGFGFLHTAHRRKQSQHETFSPQVLSELVLQRCVTGSIEVAALGASESAAALGASESAAAPDASLHLPTFTTSLVRNAAIQDVWVETFIPRRQRVAICTCSRTGRHLATFTRRPGSSLYTLTTASAQVAEAGQADVSGVLIPWIRATRRQLRERFRQDFPVLHLHSDRGGEFSSDLLVEFCRDEGIVQSFTFPASQQNGIAERRIGLVMEVACTSMIHAAAPHFLWPFEVRYAAHQLNLWPRVSEPETSPKLQWTGKVGEASVFLVLGALSLVRDAKASKLSSRALCCIFLGFPTNASPWRFYHPRERRVFSSQDVTFDESICFYRLHPHASHPVPLAPLFLVPVPPPAEGGDPAADDTAATRRSPRLETPLGFPPQPSLPPLHPAAVDFGDETAGAEPGGGETEGESCGGAATGGAGSWGVASGGVYSGGTASPRGGGAVGDPAGGPGAGQPLPDGGGYGPGGAGAASSGGTASAGGTRGTAGGAGGAAGAGGTRGAACAGCARATSPKGAIGAGGAGAGGTGGAGTAGPGCARFGGAGAAGAGGAVRAGGATRAAGSGGAEGAGGTAGAGGAGAGGTRGTGGAGGAGPGGARTRGAGAAGAGSAAGAGGATGAAGTGGAGGTAGAGSAGAGGTGGTRSAGAAGPGGARTRCAGAAGADGAASAGGARGATGATCARVSTTATAWHLPPAPAPHTEVTESLTERRKPGTRASTLVRAHRVTRSRPPAVPGTHGMALRPSSVPQRVVLLEHPASSLPHDTDPESDLACAVSPTITRLLTIVITDPDLETTLAALGFAPSTADPSLFLRTDTSLPPFYVLVYVDDLVFATADTAGLAHVKSELQKRHTCTDLGELRSYLGLQITRDRAQRTITLIQSHMVQQVLQRFDFTYSSPQATPPSTRHSLSALPSDASVEPSGPYPELVGCLITSGMGLVLGGRRPVVLTGHADASWADDQATQRSSQGYTFSLGSGCVSWRSTRSSSVLTADIFTKALAPGDHQRFCNLLVCFALLDWSCDPLFSPTLPMGLECLAATLPRFASMLLCPEGDPDSLDIPTPRSYAEAIGGEYSSRWQTAMDAEMASWKSTGTHIDEVPPPGANIVDGMWIFRVKRPPGFPPAFKIWLRRLAGFTGSFRAGTHWNLWRPVHGLLQAPQEWHDTLRTTLAALGFAPSTADPSLFLHTDTTLPPFYVLVRDTLALTWVLQRFGFKFSLPQPTPLSTGHSLSAPPSDESVEPSGLYPELVGCLMYLMTCTRPDFAYPLSLLARYVAPGRHRKVHWDAAKRVLRYLCSTSGMGLVLGGQGPLVLTGQSYASSADDQVTQHSSQGYTFRLGFGSVSWRSTRSSSVLGSNCEAEIYAGAMAAQELRWLTYLLTDLGKRPRSPSVMYQRRQLRISCVASQANTADVFTKALGSGDHQRLCTALGLVPTLRNLCVA
ncbi:unnamed protein product [Closterium sp. NIES-53]